MLGNNFVGSIPRSIGGMTNLRIFAGDLNSFNGTLPTELGLCASLEELGLSGSDIESTIPTEIGLLGNLCKYGLTDCHLVSCCCFLALTRFVAVALSLGNKLQGTIPSELGNCASMVQLALHTNAGLEGAVPSELGNLSLLEKLQLHSTSLTGTMPAAICSLRSVKLGVLESDCYGGTEMECAEPECCSLCF